MDHPSIDDESGREILACLSGEYVVPLCDGVTMYCTELPGDAVSAATKTADGELHIFVDLAKPDTYAHARTMVREWLGISCPEMITRPVNTARFV